MPKNLAIEKADRLAILVAPALLVFDRISAPFIFFAERSAAALSRWIGLRGSHTGGGHSAEELKFIVSSSRREGHLHRFEEDAIQALLELAELLRARNHGAAQRHRLGFGGCQPGPGVAAHAREPIFAAAGVSRRSRAHHRLRALQGHDADLGGAPDRGGEEARPLRPFHLSRVLRKPLVVPETKPLNDLIDEFRSTHKHMAMVVDEFGTIVGLVTLEDALEQILGEIGDEHDVKRPRPAAEAAEIEVEGTITIRDLDTQYGLELPGDAGFETLAGFLLFQLGKIPKEGEAVEYGGRRFTILQMDHNRIARVVIARVPAHKEPSEAAPRKKTASD